jgi:hypothetical protein
MRAPDSREMAIWTDSPILKLRFKASRDQITGNRQILLDVEEMRIRGWKGAHWAKQASEADIATRAFSTGETESRVRCGNSYCREERLQRGRILCLAFLIQMDH